MAIESGEKQRLLDSIKDEARNEAAAITARTDRDLGLAEDDHEARIKRAEKSESDRAEEVIRRMKIRHELAAEVEKRRARLARNQHAVEDVIALAQRRLNDSPNAAYTDAVVPWTIEAIAGLGAEEIIIEVNPGDRRIIEESLTRIVGRAKEITGIDTEVHSIAEKSSDSRGVVVRDARKQRIYDNRISTRFERFRSEVLTIIQSRLFAK